MSIIPENAEFIHTHIPNINDIKNDIQSFDIFKFENQYYAKSKRISDETDANSNFIINEVTIEETIETEKDVIILGLNGNQPIRGKIDTGAACCSLNAKDIRHQDDTVEFTFNNSRYRMDLNSLQNIQTADGGEELRPVISISCKVGDDVFKGTLINLNDRGDMADLLIGMNLIDQLNLSKELDLNEVIDQCKKALF